MTGSIGLRVLEHRDRLTQAAPGDLVALAGDALAELLPLDEQRRTEVAVWVAVIVAARTNPAVDATYGRRPMNALRGERE